MTSPTSTPQLAGGTWLSESSFVQPSGVGLEAGSADECCPGDRGSQPGPRPPPGGSQVAVASKGSGQSGPGEQLLGTAPVTGVRQQPAREEVSWDNAVVESFFSTLKLELDLDDHREALISPQPRKSDPSFWIESDYNRERRHSATGHLSTIDYAQQFTAAPTLTPVNP